MENDVKEAKWSGKIENNIWNKMNFMKKKKKKGET